MSIKSKRTITRIFATFLILSLTLCYFTIGSSAAATLKYADVNDTNFYAANCWALEELPYGEDTGVIQFMYGTDKYVTFFFDKLSIYDRYDMSDLDIGLDRFPSYVKDHYWNVKWDSSSGKLDYKLSIVSDSPIYVTTNYSSNLYNFTSVGLNKKVYAYLFSNSDGSTVSGEHSQSFYVWYLDEVSVSTFCDWTLPSEPLNRTIISNCYQYKAMSNVNPYYIPAPATGFDTSTTNGSQCAYYVEYYPTTDYLLNYEIRDVLLSQFDVMKEQLQYIQYIYGDLWTVNYYLDCIYNADLSILSNVETYLPLMETRLLDIYNVLLEIKSGPEYDSSQGIGSNTQFGDTAGGLMQDTEVPSIGTDSIQSNLGSSFLFIRNMFDWVTVNFNLVYIISFLLGLSFIAYVLGRVIKNKMNG